MKFRRKTKLFMVLILAIMTAGSALAANESIYAVSTDNANIYEINITTGVVTVATTSQFESVSLAYDGSNAYYWNAEGPSYRGMVKWNPLTNIHTSVNSFDISEKNACVDSSGNLWVLDRTNSTVDGAALHDATNYLYQIDKITGARTVSYTLPDVGGYAAGDIAWGPAGKLYISTNNASGMWQYDTNYNYLWDPTDPTNIVKKGGIYHAGLVWVDGKLYGSRTLDGTNIGAVFELDSTDFSEIVEVANMSSYGVTIGDLSNAVPEPATIFLLGLSSIALLKKHRK